MVAEGIVIALDTNLLVYAHRSATPQNLAARHAMERAFSDPRGCGISFPCIAEFWSIVTHPTAAGGPSSPTHASSFVRALMEQAQVDIWMPGDGFTIRLLSLAVDFAIQGPRIFDAQIGLIALENGATEIWTHDRNFLRLRGLSVFDPLA